MNVLFSRLPLLLALSLTACGMPAAGPAAPAASAAPSSAPSASAPAQATQAVRIRFAGQVNGKPFSCAEKYTQIGTTASEIQPQDFRFYVSQVRLRNDKGQEVPVQLEQDGKWQFQNVALLDFEDKSGSCDSGTPDTRYEITGVVPAGNYTGLSFDLGVPFDLNHQDMNRAASPLNLTSMFWVWRYGYKFARLDFKSSGLPQGFALHLGSTACTGTAPTAHTMRVQHEGHDHDAAPAAESNTVAPVSCANPNIATVSLPAYTGTQTVVADLGRLLAKTDVNVNQPESAAGCMSSPDDGDCSGIFGQLGLPFPSTMRQEQTFFALQP